MSRSPLRGRLKASALVLPRVIKSPATLRNQGGWFFENFDGMAILTLNDQDFTDLIFNIISPNKSDEIFDLLKQAPGTLFDADHCNFSQRKSLGYKDYQVRLMEFSIRESSVMKAKVEIWKPAKFFGHFGNKKIIQMLRMILWKRYGPEGQFAGVRFIQGALLRCECSWDFESTIYYEPHSDSSHGNNHTDFIFFEFERKFD
jgi:hypothetical protein